jgi:hypothetical protein
LRYGSVFPTKISSLLYLLPIPDSRFPTPDSRLPSIFFIPQFSNAEILNASDKASILAIQRQQEEAKAKHQKELQALAPRQTQIWEEINILIEKSQSKTYDRAVELLVNLRDLAAEENKFEPFQTRLDLIYDNYGNRHSLIKRLCKVRLDRS